MSDQASENTVTLTIDDHLVTVPKGTTIIEAAKELNLEIPHYCYHPSLPIVGNCRMCQVEVEGAPKLMVACHTQVQPDMKVRTHATSQKVKDAQAATLELILINHPLDCTVCDQSGHCKLQDYHFEYNAKPSRFVEDKVQKVKAESLGPTVMLDGERCIMCTRCIRFCDEITKTSELGMVNRGDRSMIAINPGKELNNPFSGNVVDLCPVGALTHKKWRFNTRIWYTKQANTICPGCSTGCNAKVAVRDNQVVHVKARENKEVNGPWMCDEGRYGFDRFVPKKPLRSAYIEGQTVSREEVVATCASLKGSKTLFFLSGHLLLEDFYVIDKFIKTICPESKAVLPYKERNLTELEQMLISPDYCANYKGAQFFGLIGEDPESEYQQALSALSNKEYEQVAFIGDNSILEEDLTDSICALKSYALISEQNSKIFKSSSFALPARSLFQKSGLMISSKNRLQYSERLFEFSFDTHPEWRLLNMISESLGGSLSQSKTDREMTLELVSGETFPESKSIGDLKSSGMTL